MIEYGLVIKCASTFNGNSCVKYTYMVKIMKWEVGGNGPTSVAVGFSRVVGSIQSWSVVFIGFDASVYGGFSHITIDLFENLLKSDQRRIRFCL